MATQEPSKLVNVLAWGSGNCPVCNIARRKQSGMAFWLVKNLEDFCPLCRSYRRVHGRKSHEPLPPPPNQ